MMMVMVMMMMWYLPWMRYSELALCQRASDHPEASKVTWSKQGSWAEAYLAVYLSAFQMVYL